MSEEHDQKMKMLVQEEYHARMLFEKKMVALDVEMKASKLHGWLKVRMLGVFTSRKQKMKIFYVCHVLCLITFCMLFIISYDEQSF